MAGEKVANILAKAKNDSELANKVEKALHWLQDADHHLLTLADSDYPQTLINVGLPPPVLYMQGKREILGRPSRLAVVGSRQCSQQGLINATQFSKALSDLGWVIVSGMALGIDTAAHQGGLEGIGGTIAVTGTGLDITYPKSNQTLANAITQKGLIISEFALGTPPLATNFPRRNRIISGLSQGVLVVEANMESGSLITARLAGEQGREVFAIPGSIHSPYHKGCHHLIRQGAKLVETTLHILEELPHTVDKQASLLDRYLSDTPPPPPSPVSSEDTSSKEEKQLLEWMGYEPILVDHLIEHSGLSIDQLSAQLLQLELKGLITHLPGGRIQRIFSSTPQKS